MITPYDKDELKEKIEYCESQIELYSGLLFTYQKELVKLEESEMTIAYICDRKKKCNTSSSCGVECIRTVDRTHSANYQDAMPTKEMLDAYFEKHGSDSNAKYYER